MKEITDKLANELVEKLDKTLKTMMCRAFNFSPDEPFVSAAQIMETARKNLRHGAYECGAAYLAPRLARYIDDIKHKGK